MKKPTAKKSGTRSQKKEIERAAQGLLSDVLRDKNVGATVFGLLQMQSSALKTCENLLSSSDPRVRRDMVKLILSPALAAICSRLGAAPQDAANDDGKITEILRDLSTRLPI